MSRHAVRHTAQHPVEPLLAVRAQDDEIGAPLPGAVDDGVPRIAVAQRCRDSETRATELLRDRFQQRRGVAPAQLVKREDVVRRGRSSAKPIDGGMPFGQSSACSTVTCVWAGLN